MKLRVDRRRLHAMFIVFTAVLLGGGVSAARSGNHALESVLVACSRMLFLFGEHLSVATAFTITIFALLVSGVFLAVCGFVRDVLTLRSLEMNAQKGAVMLSEKEPHIFLTHRIPHQAWTSGIITPRIYLASESYKKLSAGERKALIAHEVAHVQNHDVLKRALANGLRRLFWFVPTISEVVDVMRFSQEVRADHAAMQVAGKRALCSLYLSTSSTKIPAHASGFAFATPRLAEVLEGRLQKAELSWLRLSISLCMTVFIFFGGWHGVTPQARAEAPATCAIIETMAPQSFTPLVGPLELHTPNSENACSENLSC